MAGTGVHFQKVIPKKVKIRRAINILNGAVNSIGNDIKKDFEKTTATWNHKPHFVKEYSIKYGGPQVEVYTIDQIYGYVNDGVDGGYYIFPRRVSRLAYQGRFRPKTKPEVIGSNAGGKFGAMVYRSSVIHPGIEEPRQFDDVIYRKWRSQFNLSMALAMARATEVTGHRF